MSTTTKMNFSNLWTGIPGGIPGSIPGATPNRAARREPAIRVPALRLRLRASAIMREGLTIGAVAGLIWFQWEILRGCW